jgi:hypothetical protein
MEHNHARSIAWLNGLATSLEFNAKKGKQQTAIQQATVLRLAINKLERCPNSTRDDHAAAADLMNRVNEAMRALLMN